MRLKHASDSCTTILVGKEASYDGSTIVARTEDSQNGVFTPKKFVVVSLGYQRICISHAIISQF